MSNYKDEYRATRRKSLAKAIPLPRAICKLLYTLCKIRGEKVITRFLNNEPKYLEPLLDAFQAWDENINPAKEKASPRYGPMVWEERYVMLLWLSHLMLAPFDLASISSPELSQGHENLPTDMKLPSELPVITQRIIPMCTKYITVASKEREAARALLVRIALRPDMRRIGLLESSVHWALLSLETESNEAASKSIYAHVGVLSFLAGILVSAERAAIAPFLMQIFQNIQNLNASQTPLSSVIISSALARKVIIKILRAVTVTILEPDTTISSAIPKHLIGGVLEDVIDYLLTALADKDTPVRYAASKALSVIALKLDASMAADVVEAVVGSLGEDVLWEDATTGLTIDNYHASQKQEASFTRNLTCVSALRWQGLVLTLSHLLYRRSPPPELLPEILNSLILALGFEQRSAVGSSVGTNVRDAACFGIWAMARRYTTKELLHVDTSTILAANTRSQSSAVLQILSNELVVAATLDSSGNLRRGASAALQELIGRHPDTIIEGISLVQVVDYHAVALRSRAMKEVAVGASKLSESYWNVLQDGFLGWRGIGSPDAESRRQAATAIGLLSMVRDHESTQITINRVCHSLRLLQHRQIEERHGLLLSLAAVVHSASFENPGSKLTQSSALNGVWGVFEKISPLSTEDFTSSVLRPELTAEAACCVISSLALASCSPSSGQSLLPHPPQESLDGCLNILNSCLVRTEDVVIAASSKAAEDIFEILDDLERERLARIWISSLDIDASGRSRGTSKANGYVAALGTVYRFFQSPRTDVSAALTGALLSLAAPQMQIESKVAAMKSLSVGALRLEGEYGNHRWLPKLTLPVMTTPIANTLLTSLKDYTADQRGDVGSLVRVEAIDAVGVSWANGLLNDEETERKLLALVCGLAAEKLDKVRIRAWRCLQSCWKVFGEANAPPMSAFLPIKYLSFLTLLQPIFRRGTNVKSRLFSATPFATLGGLGSTFSAGRLRHVSWRRFRVAPSSFESRLGPLC